MKIVNLFLIQFLLCHLCLSQQLFDNHVHLWNGNESLQSYLDQVDSTGLNITRFGGILIARRGELLKTKAKNDELIELSKRNPKLLPICSVHPLDGDAAIQELKRLSTLGVRVIKIHAHTQEFEVTDPMVLKLCKEAGKLGLVMLMDNASIKPGDCENLFNLALKCPDTKFIFAHMGALNFRFWNIMPAIRTAKDLYYDNIYFDISATVVLVADSPIEDEFVWTLRNAGIDHILLGSDFPQYTLRQNVDALDKLDLKPEEKDKIRYENARRLLFPDAK
jgi:uncharacterized protein